MFDAGPNTAFSLAEVERRLALFDGEGRVAVQDQLDWAEALAAAGGLASARLLFQAAFVQQGFSPQLEQARRGLPDGVEAMQPAFYAAQGRPRGGNTVDLAIEELRGFARAFGASMAAGRERWSQRSASAPGLHPTAVLRRAATPPSERPVAALVGDLYGWLRSDPGAADDDRGTAAIEALRGPDGAPGRVAATALSGAPSPLLASAIAAQELRLFLRGSGDLLLGALGSPGLFHAASAFDSAGLGPYFGNVAQIVRRSANLRELAAIAEEAACVAGEGVGEEAWIVLLSRGLRGGLREEVIDDLGDRNAAFALQMMLERFLSSPVTVTDRLLILRIRDAALDNLDYDVAGIAQRWLVAADPTDLVELHILGAIDASAGRVVAADQSLSLCLNSDPENLALQQEVAANLARRYAPFAVTQGYGSPQDRQLKRLHRRASAAPVGA